MWLRESCGFKIVSLCIYDLIDIFLLSLSLSLSQVDLNTLTDTGTSVNRLEKALLVRSKRERERGEGGRRGRDEKECQHYCHERRLCLI